MALKIEPYKLYPVAPYMALLCPSGNIFHETMGFLSYESCPGSTQIWASYETVGELLAQEKGEALTWNGTPIRWHPNRTDGKWGKGQNDARVLRLDFPTSHYDALEALCLWRDWLAQYGASPLGSLGSTGFSLLRARLKEPLWCSAGDLPPLYATIGGRQELAVPIGSYTGFFRHHDLPAAYAKTLGELRYGGRWREVSTRYPFEAANSWGMLCFIRAKIKIPSTLQIGPLPKRPHGRPSVWTQVLMPTPYPRNTTLQGIWTLEEIQAAVKAGCKIKKILNIWVHITEDESSKPFGSWWKAIQEGRAIGGFAGALAKASGNALWGQFCISEGRRSVQYWRRTKHGPIRESSSLPMGASRPNAFDLAESITGRVRAKLYNFMVSAGENLISAHTDGAWCRDNGWPGLPEWRSKDTAERIDILTPQTLRYIKPRSKAFTYCVAGVPSPLAPEVFQKTWEANGFD